MYQHALGRSRSQAAIWYVLTALTAGCRHLVYAFHRDVGPTAFGTGDV